MNISLPDQIREWAQEQIEEGEYASTSDYIRDLIRRDQAQRDKIEALQRAIDEGLGSGKAEQFDFEALKSAMRSRSRGSCGLQARPCRAA